MSVKRFRAAGILPLLMVAVLLTAIGLCSRSPAEAAYADRAAAGGLRLTGRALVAVPQDDFSVLLTWRALEPEDGGTAFDVLRSTRLDGNLETVGRSRETTTFRDRPGEGTFYYCVIPQGGKLKGRKSNLFKVFTCKQGRDWVEILPAARGRKLQFSDRHFADTDGDGDGELEFVTHYPQVPSYRGGVLRLIGGSDKTG
jgi:hypothetical protein